MADNMLLVTQCHESNTDSFILPAGYDLKTTATSAVVSLPVIEMSRGRKRSAVPSSTLARSSASSRRVIISIKSLLPLIA